MLCQSESGLAKIFFQELDMIQVARKLYHGHHIVVT